MTMPQTHVGEIDGSIDDFMSSVRAAFDKQFPRGNGINGGLAEPSYWIRDIFEDRVIVEDGAQLYRVDMTIADGRITFASRQEWGKVRLSYIREYTVGEFRGDFPAVPTAAGVDLDALKSEDKDPFFVTLPVAGVNATSANGLLYDEALVNSIVEQINRDHPTGIMGHLRAEDLGTAYPEPEVYWVGATQADGKAWAKGYVVPGKARTMLQRLKAVGGKAATSIFGPPPGRRVQLGDGKWRMEGFQLQSLDLAPYERAALKLGGAFQVTAELAQPANAQTSEVEGIDMPTREELIAELTVTDIPAAIREQIVKESQESQSKDRLISELQEQVKSGKTVVETLQGQLATYQTRETAATVDRVVNEFVKLEARDDQGKAKVDALRSLFRGQLISEIGEERDEDKIKEKAQAIWDGSMKVVAETFRDALAGPPAAVGGRARTGGKSIEDTPESRAKARAEMGL